MHRAIRPAAFLTIFLCSGCAAGSGRPPASDVGQRASADYTDCLDRAARKFDNHISDVQIIAPLVSDTCLWQAHAFEETFYQGLRPEDRAAILEKLSTGDSRQRAAVQAVLRERAAQ